MAGPSSRMLALLSLLQSRRDWPGRLLADRLKTSTRTVRRDVDRLRELGYRVTAAKGPDGGYRLEAGSELPPLLFDDEQALALALALQTAPIAGTGLEDAALRALTTVRQTMPSRLRHRMDAVSITAVRDPLAAAAPIQTDTLLLLSAAARTSETVRFEYAGDMTSGEPLPANLRPGELRPGELRPSALRTVEPHHVLAWRGRWYLLGWDLDRDDWRIFRVDRISPRSHLGPRFGPRELPGGDAEAFVTARFRGTDADGSWPCRGEVIVETAASTIAPYLGDATIEPLGPDRCRVRLGSWSWHGMAATLGALDADLTVVGPVELREAVVRMSHRFAAAAQ